MRYEYKSEDVFDFLKANSIEYRVRGDEIEAKHCPYCKGADRYFLVICALCVICAFCALECTTAI